MDKNTLLIQKLVTLKEYVAALQVFNDYQKNYRKNKNEHDLFTLIFNSLKNDIDDIYSLSINNK